MALLLLLGVLWFVQLDYRALKDSDEGRYAEIPYTMYSSGDWLTPRLNGFKYFEKPPLQYWGTAAIYHAFGVSNGTSRLWCASLGFFGILWSSWLGGRLFGRQAGLFSGLVLASSLLYGAMGHMNTLDMGLTFFLSVGLGSLIVAQTQRQDSAHVRRWMLLAWAGVAGAIMSKGLIGLVLPGAAVILYSLWQRDFTLWANMHFAKGILLFLALTAPWFVVVSQENPEFLQFFFIHEHFARYTSTIHQRDGHLLYFVPLFLAGSLPWLNQAIIVLFKPTFSWRPVTNRFNPQRLLWVYIVCIFLFFSVSNSKLIPYILPMFPALALLIGEHLSRKPDLKHNIMIMAVFTLLLLLVGTIMVSFLHNSRNPPEVLANFRPWVLAAATVLALSLIAIHRFANFGQAEDKTAHGQNQNILAAILLTIGSICAFQLLGWGYHATSMVHSTQNMSESINAYVSTQTEEHRNPTIYCVHCYYQSLSFYQQKPVVIVGYQGELEMGITQEPQQWIADFPTFLARWQQDSTGVAILYKDEAINRSKQGMAMQIIYKDASRVAVVHPQ